MTCVDSPISWLRLEQHALARDPDVEAHVARCPACRACFDEIRGEVVALPALAVPERKRRAWWTWAAPAFGLAAAAAIVFLVVRPKPREDESIARVKGIGEVIVDVVRERGGAITESARTFRAGDRWKVVVTCPPDAHAQLDVEVRDPHGVDRPLPGAQLACGNRVIVPGAFELTGSDPNRVCVRVTGAGGDVGVACVTVRPE
ncbi:MAG TPA: hypothetical protein VGF94_19410 [Kofleriaceae bacterium]|jgi:hypothetical protein